MTLLPAAIAGTYTGLADCKDGERDPKKARETRARGAWIKYDDLPHHLPDGH